MYTLLPTEILAAIRILNIFPAFDRNVTDWTVAPDLFACLYLAHDPSIELFIPKPVYEC
jgi:hypothetical protein